MWYNYKKYSGNEIVLFLEHSSLLAFCQKQEVNSLSSSVSGWSIGILMTLSRSVHAEQSSNRMFHAIPCNELRKSRTMLPKSFTPSLVLGWTGELCIVKLKRGCEESERKIFSPLQNLGFRSTFFIATNPISRNLLSREILSTQYFKEWLCKKLTAKIFDHTLFRMKLSYSLIAMI